MEAQSELVGGQSRAGRTRGSSRSHQPVEVSPIEIFRWEEVPVLISARVLRPQILWPLIQHHKFIVKCTQTSGTASRRRRRPCPSSPAGRSATSRITWPTCPSTTRRVGGVPCIFRLLLDPASGEHVQDNLEPARAPSDSPSVSGAPSSSPSESPSVSVQPSVS